MNKSANLWDAPQAPPDVAPSALRIDPADNVLIGAQRIMRYLGISSITTLYSWIEDGALPAIKRPYGKWMTTMTAIDTWIFQAAGLVSDQANQTTKRIAARAGRGVGLLRGRKDPKSPYVSSQRERDEKAGRPIRRSPYQLRDEALRAKLRAAGETNPQPEAPND